MQQQLQKLDAMTYTEELDASLLHVIRSDAWRAADRWVRLDVHDLTVRTVSGGNGELVARRVNHFFRLGILKKESRRINGKRVSGMIVPVTLHGRSGFTREDNGFLAECGISPIAHDDVQAVGAAPPLNTDSSPAHAAASL
jgi:hypothetical protein